MKVLPSIQLDAILYFLKMRLRTDATLLSFTEHNNSDEIVRATCGYLPIYSGQDENGEAFIGATITPPGLAIVPTNVFDTSEGLGIANEYQCDIYYIVEVSEADTYKGRFISGEEKAYRQLLAVWRKLGEYCLTPYLGDHNNPSFDLVSDGKIKGMDINRGSFAIAGGAIAYIKAVLSFDTISPPYHKAAPDILSTINLELQNGEQIGADEGPVFSGSEVLDNNES